MDIEKFKAEFMRTVEFFDRINANTGCCKWDKHRGSLFQYSVEEVMKEPVDASQGYSEQSLMSAAFRASSRLVDEVAERKNITNRNGLLDIHGPNSYHMIKEVNDFVVSGLG